MGVHPSPQKCCRTSSTRSLADAEGASHSIGLGLFIARAIVQAHGGQIQVSSSTHAGTTFTITLPKAP